MSVDFPDKVWYCGVLTRGTAYTGLRTGELLGLLNSNINLEERFLEVHQGVKEVCKRSGTEFIPGREVKVGKTQTATSKRRVLLNGAPWKR